MTTEFAREISTERLRDGDHLAYAYLDEPRLAAAVTGFVKRGVSRNQTNVFLVTKADAARYAAFLKEAGLDVEELVASGMITIETVDPWLAEERLDSVLDLLKEKLVVYGNAVREQGRSGLNIIGTIADVWPNREGSRTAFCSRRSGIGRSIEPRCRSPCSVPTRPRSRIWRDPCGRPTPR